MADLKVTAKPGSQNINSIVTIKVPKEKLFEAFTNPELFAKWCGSGHDLEVSCFDATSGGKWLVTERTPEGDSYAFLGSFYEIAAGERIIQTFEFDGLPEKGHVALERVV